MRVTDQAIPLLVSGSPARGIEVRVRCILGRLCKCGEGYNYCKTKKRTMSITDKTRKILWGRSGNRCAICKHELVVNATASDDESVVGDECHIVSSRPNGPRHDPSCPCEKLDAYDNLILLCRVHHKMVDDQDDTYSVDILRQMRANHEVWVSQKLADTPPMPRPITIRRIEQNVPDFLYRLTTGKQVLDLVTGAYFFSVDQDEPRSQEEIDLIGGFLQAIEDWADICDILDFSDRVSRAYDITLALNELEEAGFFVFGGREVQLIEGGIATEPADCPIVILYVLRKDNKAIINVSFSNMKKEDIKPTDLRQRSKDGN